MSKNFARCKKAYDKKWITAEGLKVWVDPSGLDPDKITPEEYEIITGVPYTS